MSTGHVETAYGDGILDREVAEAGTFVAVVDPVAWELCRPSLTVAPRRVLVPANLDQDELDKLAADVPPASTVVGIGGGMVVDAAKYLSLAAGGDAVLVPSITSSNAPFSDFISVRRNGEPTGMVAPGQPKRVIVDFELIGRADPRLNRAGFADLLAHQVALRDWRHAAERGQRGVSEDAFRAMADVMDECRAAAGDVGEGGRRGIEFVMRTFERMTRLLDEHRGMPIDAGSEHLVAWNLEAVTGRHFIHGEAVALGIVACAMVYGDDDSSRRALDRARVRYRLRDLGVSWAEFEQTLRTVDAYNRRVRRFDTVFTDLDWTVELFADLRSVLGG